MVLFSLECSGCKATLTSDSNFRPLPVEKETAAVTRNELNKMIQHGHGNGMICSPSSPTKNFSQKKNAKSTYRNKMIISRDDCSDVHSSSVLSSTSFSSDSAEYYSHPSKIKIKNKTPPSKRDRGRQHGRKIIEEKAAAEVDRGVAVERKSTDLYGDFRRSMVEMIMARGKLRVGDMNRLLESYIALNSPEHHPVIVRAFSDIYKGCSLQQIMATN